ncbi:putative porin [Nonlabens agnitus]|uniref:putative porin n=1 Tax=Nonlabens agnitus TaxID=870484 RepID=UPI001F5B9D99|nr:putative porin [Nonlabens agnitus]
MSTLIKSFLLFSLLLVTASAYALQQPVRDNLGNNGRQRPLSNKEVSVEGEKPPITDYLIISQDRDTTYVDTTLSMAKEFKFNYLRQDNFELMPFPNIGQPYNRLIKRFDMEQLTPRMGAEARHDNYYEISDINDYYVPTPLTDLYFKTAINQGQQLDALFTSNISPQFNFSISYKGMRSAGDFVNTLTSTGNFKFTSNYFSKDKRYRLRLHTVFQDLSNQESGGLAPDALQGYLDQDENLDDRGRLEPNLDDAVSLLDGKRFYIDHDYELLKSADSLKNYSLRVHNKMYFEDKFYRYEEDNASTEFLGEAYQSTNIKDKTNYEESYVEVGASLDHYLFGYMKAGIAKLDYNYGYDRIVNRGTEVITNRLASEVYQFKAAFEKRLGVFEFQAHGGINIAGELDGQYLNAMASVDFKDFTVAAGAGISSRAPNFNLLLHQSEYEEYNWQNSFNNVEKQQLNLQVKSEKYFDVELEVNTIQDYAYFRERNREDVAPDFTGYVVEPFQTDEQLTYLKIKAHKSFEFLRYFGTDHTLAFQTVDQTADIINVPSFLTRNSLYYKDRWFKKAMLVQTGITLKYFDEYNMDGYDPVLGEFYSQNSAKLGAFPLVDIFFNAKIQQTRIFVKLENATSPLGEPNFFSAPRTPFRDLSLRFGLVWNFFL